jgi:hypothetical protein
MSSAYSRDPSVPPVHLEHLGKRRPGSSSSADSESDAKKATVDDGPSYQDFLEGDLAETEPQGETG